METSDDWEGLGLDEALSGRTPNSFVQPVRSEERLFTMTRRQHLLQMIVVLCAVGAVHAQQPDAAQIAQERRQAELDAPKLVEVLELKPGMTITGVQDLAREGIDERQFRLGFRFVF